MLDPEEILRLCREATAKALAHAPIGPMHHQEIAAAALKMSIEYATGMEAITAYVKANAGEKG